MLHSLSVSNYVLIGSLEITFPEGLVIISGETGAGKSILLGALSLALGAKADSTMIGPAGDTCTVEACFTHSDEADRLLLDNDLPCENEFITIRRVLSRSGRSRSFLCDEPVQVAVLQQLSAILVDIHSQHQTLRLQDPTFRMRALDLYAGATDARSECEKAWDSFTGLRKELDRVREIKAPAIREEDYRRSRLEKLQQAALVPDELEELEQEQKRLSHAEELKEMLSQASSLLYSEEDSIPSRLRESARLLDRASSYIGAMEPLSQRLEQARVEIEDISADIEQAAESLEVSPARLEAVDARLGLLYELMRKYGASSIEELIGIRDALLEEIEGASALEFEEKRLEKELEKAGKEHVQASARLHELREKAAGAFSQAIVSQLRLLEMEHATFSAELRPCEPGPSGIESIQFMFSSTGQGAVDVSKAASGGELSRIMLSLKAIMAGFTHMPTMVFDEIDTGVSGRTAHKMGDLVCSMGEKMQVFAITHLPQVAAKGKAHYLVSKTDDVTTVKRLDEAGRVMEIARMLSGASISPAAIENAKTLLNS